MTTVLETKATSGLSPAVSAMQDIPLVHIQESKTNPRRQFDEAKLAELSDNIRLHGVLQPVLVRPLPGGKQALMNLSPGRGVTAPRNSPDGKLFPLPFTNSPTHNALSSNSSKICNAPMSMN